METIRSLFYFAAGAAFLGFGGYAWRHGLLAYEPKRMEGLSQLLTRRISAGGPAQPGGQPRTLSVVNPTPEPASSEEGAPAPKPQSRAPRWRIRGQVYDLITLVPVSGARIIFLDKAGGKRTEARADARGRYEADLPSLEEGGYAISVSHKRYGGLFLEEGDVSFRSMARSHREEIRDTLHASNVAHVPLQLPDGQAELEHDLALAR